MCVAAVFTLSESRTSLRPEIPDYAHPIPSHPMIPIPSTDPMLPACCLLPRPPAFLHPHTAPPPKVASHRLGRVLERIRFSHGIIR